MRRSVLFSLAATLLVGCEGPDLVQPTDELIADPLLAILDGAHTGHISGFYFLPPLVPQPEFSGDFDAGLAPVVEVCELVADDCGAIVASFTDVPVAGQHYLANWHTKASGLEDGTVYRITVRLGGTELGFADVVARQKVSRKKQGTDPFPLKIGRTLPIKFRIEERRAFVPTTDTELAGEHNFAEVHIPAGVTVTFTDDLVLNVEGDITIEGALMGDCLALTINGNANTFVSGEVSNACPDETEDLPGMAIVGNGETVIEGATFSIAGAFELRNDPTLDVESVTPLAASGSAAAPPEPPVVRNYFILN